MPAALYTVDEAQNGFISVPAAFCHLKEQISGE